MHLNAFCNGVSLRKLITKTNLAFMGVRKNKQIFRIMKLVAFLLIAGIHVSAKGIAQISLNEKNTPLENVFKAIEKQSGYVFFYDYAWLQEAKSVSIKVKNASLTEVLNECFKDQPLSYSIIGKTIVVKQKEELKTERQGTVEKAFNLKIEVSGTITDIATGKPLAGATVKLKGSNEATTTDENGNFMIEVPGAGSVLVISYVGYETIEVTISKAGPLKLTLKQKESKAEEIVVVGYGTQSKRDVTSAVTTITPKDFNKGIVTNVNTLLAGKVAGLFVSQPGSDPTQGPSVQLRGASTFNISGGSNQPLYVIDGFPGADIGTVAPEDIVSIDVAKDASSTAIYGTRGANGVIFITTRRGQAGTTLSYNTYYGMESVSNRMKVATGDEVRAYLASVNLPLSNLDNDGANTDWQKVITRKGYTKNNNISLGGGNEDTHYFASITFNDRTGVVLKSYSNRFTGRFNLDQDVFNKRLKLSLNVANNVINNSTIDNNVYYYALRFMPTSNVYGADGSYKQSPGRQNYFNPLEQINDADLINKYNIVTANGKAVFKVIEGLNLTGAYGIQNSDNLYSEFRTINNPAYSSTGGYAQRISSKSGTSVFEIYSDYSKSFGKHSIKLLAGYSDQKDFFGDGVGAQSVGFLSNSSGYYGLLNGNLPPGYNTLLPTPSYTDDRLISLYSRLNYNYDDKYILQGVIRRDGSSKFGANNKWAIFPAVSAAWVMSRESFLENNYTLNYLKIRASYGVSGNQGIGSYASLSRYGASDRYYSNGTFNQGYYFTQNANPDLKWEKTATTDIGLDFGLWGDRLTGSVDYYYKLTTDLLNNYQVPVPPYPVNLILANGGSLYNRGIEVALAGIPIINKNFNWKTSFIFAANKNKIITLSNGLYSQGKVFTGNVGGQGLTAVNSQIQEAGQALGTWYLPIYAGKDPATGVATFYKADGSIVKGNAITSSDDQILGQALPKFTYGWSNNFNYKNWGFSFTFRGSYGNKLLNALATNLDRLSSLQSYNVSQASIKEGNTDFPIYSSYYLENGSFLRLDNAFISYKLPVHTKFIKTASLNISGQNLFTITKFSGIDPEIDVSSPTPGINGIGSALGSPATYFRTRTVTLGFNIGF